MSGNIEPDEDIDLVVEAVAMAIRETVADRSRWGQDWNRLPRKVREDYRKEAVAAIAAYRKALPE